MTPQSSKTTGNPRRSAFGAFLVSIFFKHFFLQSPSSLYICSHITMQSKTNKRKKMASCSIALMALVCLLCLSNARRVFKVENPSGHEMRMRMVKAAMGKDSERATGKGIGDGSDGEGIGEGYGVGRGSGKGVGYGKGIGEGSGRGNGIGIGRSSTDGGYGEGRGVGIGTGHGGYETEHGPWRGRPGYGHSADSGVGSYFGLTTASFGTVHRNLFS